MDFGSMLDDSFAYAKDGVWERWTRWLLLIVSMIIFPLILGYIVRIYRGEKPAPEPREWGTLFIDGLKLLLVQIVYFLPVILLVILAFVPMISTLIASGALSEDFGTMSESQATRWLTSHPELLSAAGMMVLLLLVAIVLAIIIMIFSFIGTVRFARIRSISAAFDFSGILAHIGRIGWINYIIALLIITVIGFIFGMVLNIFSVIPVIGGIIGFIISVILYVPFILFSARYATLIYDAGEEKPAHLSGQAGTGPARQ
jgi:MFS family permease